MLLHKRREALFEASSAILTRLAGKVPRGFFLLSSAAMFCSLLLFLPAIGVGFMGSYSLPTVIAFTIMAMFVVALASLMLLTYMLHVGLVVFKDGYYSGWLPVSSLITGRIPVIPWRDVEGVEWWASNFRDDRGKLKTQTKMTIRRRDGKEDVILDCQDAKGGYSLLSTLSQTECYAQAEPEMAWVYEQGRSITCRGYLPRAR